MKHIKSIKKAGSLYSISLIAFFAGLHTAIPNYFNSSFLATFADEKTISLIYLTISAVTIFGLLIMHKMLSKIGNLRASLLLIILQLAVFYELIHSTLNVSVVILFILGMSIISLIWYTVDIFIQRGTDIGHTGRVRGMVMTATNLAWVIGPLIGGLLISGEDYRGVYIAAFALLFPILYLVYKNFNNFKDAHYIKMSARQTLARIIRDKDISKIFVINIVLQTFYTWMTIYVPIYMHNTIGFGWGEISLILTIMLIPFALIELPLGKLADKRWGEKEMMAIGYVIMGISTASLFLFTSNNLAIWATMLFITRIGAATIEIMIETYFFKKVDGKDPEVLSMFRITRPLAIFIAPLIVTIGLVYTTDQYLFIVFGVICLLTLYPVLTIRDTN